MERMEGSRKALESQRFKKFFKKKNLARSLQYI